MFQLRQVFFRNQTNCRRISNWLRMNSFSTASPVEDVKTIQYEKNQDFSSMRSGRKIDKPGITASSQNNIVAAAFASLHFENNSSSEIKTPFTDNKILHATSVDDLLSISEGNGVSRRHALKVVSTLADWSATGKIKLSDFEKDPRFIRLCKILTKGSAPSIRNSVNRSEDLTTVLSVTADDEAAKLIASITLPQMVKVMSTLSLKRRRSALLLRSLAYNISKSPERLDIKQSADVLYSMSVLNFFDDNLISKIVTDVTSELNREISKSAVVGSVITSLGLLKYKNTEIWDALSEWIVNNYSICRPQDIFSYIMSLAVVNYLPSNSEKVFEVLRPQLTFSEAGEPHTWLEVVWSLLLLKKADKNHISSVLDQTFLTKITDNANISTKLKLLNVDAAAQYLYSGYDGPRIPADSKLRSTQLMRTKEKNELVEAVVSALNSLIQSKKNLRYNVNSGLGFFIDAECLLGSTSNDLDLKETDKSIKVAIITLDFYDMCRGKMEPCGLSLFAKDILEAQKYKVLFVPYNEFKPKDKLIVRVQYLESKIKEILSSS